MNDQFLCHVKQPRVILCQDFRESGSLFIYIYTCAVLFLRGFLNVAF